MIRIGYHHLYPWANQEEVKKEYDLDVSNELPNDNYEAFILLQHIINLKILILIN